MPTKNSASSWRPVRAPNATAPGCAPRASQSPWRERRSPRSPQWPIKQCLGFFATIRLNPRERQIAGRVVEEIHDRLEFLAAVGLDYLSLSRTANTLSGGESQRIRLATQIGSRLRGVLYVLDEPSDRIASQRQRPTPGYARTFA